MKQIKFYLPLLIFSIFLLSCGSDEDGAPNAFVADVIVVNEGNFSNADGSITGYNVSSDSAKQQLFDEANGFSITASIQNIEKHNANYYIIGNNPSKVLVADGNNMTLTGSISAESENLNNPFAFEAVGDKGYITNWGTFNDGSVVYENSFITVVDLADFSVIKTIAWDFQPQDLMSVGNKLYVANVNSNSISVIDAETDEVIDHITTPFGPDKMVKDKNDKIWVICNAGALVRIDPSDNSIEQTIEGVITSGFNEKLIINAAGDKLYNLAVVYSSDYTTSTTSVYETSIDQTTASSEPIAVGETFYGIGISADNTLFVGDHNGFQGTGTVYMYSTNGTKQGEFESGIGPNGFLFN